MAPRKKSERRRRSILRGSQYRGGGTTVDLSRVLGYGTHRKPGGPIHGPERTIGGRHMDVASWKTLGAEALVSPMHKDQIMDVFDRLFGRASVDGS